MNKYKVTFYRTELSTYDFIIYADTEEKAKLIANKLSFDGLLEFNDLACSYHEITEEHIGEIKIQPCDSCGWTKTGNAKIDLERGCDDCTSDIT